MARYLARVPSSWSPYDSKKKQFTTTPQLPAWALPGKAAPPSDAPYHDEPEAGKPKAEMPKNGMELLNRLLVKERRLIVDGRCGPNDLIGYVRDAGSKAGFGSDIERWSGPAMGFAATAVKAFVAGLVDKANQPAPAPSPAPAPVPKQSHPVVHPDQTVTGSAMDFPFGNNASPNGVRLTQPPPTKPVGNTPTPEQLEVGIAEQYRMVRTRVEWETLGGAAKLQLANGSLPAGAKERLTAAAEASWARIKGSSNKAPTQAPARQTVPVADLPYPPDDFDD